MGKQSRKRKAKHREREESRKQEGTQAVATPTIQRAALIQAAYPVPPVYRYSRQDPAPKQPSCYHSRFPWLDR